MNSFSYTISSADNFEGGTSNVANHAVVVNVNISIEAAHRFFKCRVKNFVINPASFTAGTTAGRFINLVSPNFATSNSYISGNKINQLIAICDLGSGINNNVDNTFYIDNPNGKYLTFYLQDEFFNNIPYGRLNQNTFNTTWYLTLELTPLDEEHQTKQNLRHGL